MNPNLYESFESISIYTSYVAPKYATKKVSIPSDFIFPSSNNSIYVG